MRSSMAAAGEWRLAGVAAGRQACWHSSGPRRSSPRPFAGASSRRLAVVRAELAGAAVATSAPRFHIELVIDGLFLSM
jgi:hypothetical protein